MNLSRPCGGGGMREAVGAPSVCVHTHKDPLSSDGLISPMFSRFTT